MMAAATPYQRFELLRIADARLDLSLGIEALVSAAAQLEAFVRDGAPAAAPAMADDPYSGTRARDWLPDLEPGEPGSAVDGADSVAAGVPLAEAADTDALYRGQIERVFAQLLAAVDQALPCPRNLDLGGPLDLSAAAASLLVCDLRDSGRIEIESRGSKRRVGIDGRWTLWTGGIPPAAPGPVAEPLPDAPPSMAAPIVPPDEEVKAAAAFLRTRGYTVSWVAGDWMINDRDITPAELVAKAEAVRSRSSSQHATTV